MDRQVEDKAAGKAQAESEPAINFERHFPRTREEAFGIAKRASILFRRQVELNEQRSTARGRRRP